MQCSFSFTMLCLRLFLILQGALGYFNFGITCIPGSEWSTGQCGEKCRCLASGVIHCAPNPCVLVKHNSNGEVEVREMMISSSGISFGRDLTGVVDKRTLSQDKAELHKRFLNYNH